MLRYYHRPDYEQIESLFVTAIQRRNIDRKAPFEWGAPKSREYIPGKKAHEYSAEKLNKAGRAPVTLPQATSSEATPVEYRVEATQCA